MTRWRAAILGLLFAALALVGGCVLVVAPALAVTVSGTSPWEIDRVTIGSTTDWEVYNVPGWVAQLEVCNEGSAGTVLVGNYDETGTVAAGDDYATLNVGDCKTLPLTQANGRGDATHWAVPLASTTASQVASLTMVETAQ